MAARRFYAYYVRGSQLAIVEYDNVSGSGQTLGQPSLDDIGPSGALSWKSPVAAVTDGLEIEYAYSPRYSVAGRAVTDLTKFYINGWTVRKNNNNNYLVFLKAHDNDIVAWDAGAYNFTSAGTDYIVVRGSSRWNGLHKVNLATAIGELWTTTIVPEGVPYWAANQQVDFATDETIFDGGAGTLYLADHFSAGDYIWISGSNEGKNNGLFSVSSATKSSTAASSKLTLGTRYSTVNSSDADSSSTGLDTEYSEAAALTGDTDEADITIYKAYRDFSYILTDVDALNDEFDTIDLPEYLAKALVYYVKSKLSEDRGEIEQKAYFMREFQRILEKHESSKMWGPRMMIPGSHGIR